MRQNNLILPQQCRKCGTYFDLWYELSENIESQETLEISERFGKKLAESLCWHCKQEVIKTIKIQEVEQEDPQDNLILDLEFE